MEFGTPKSGLSTPINRTNPGFIGGGKTAGGAREFAIPNQKIPAGAKVKTVN
ncbi:polymorphic toxin type 10 domain-containing protein [Aquimarina longa]|uniref:polymorphic toxin type 10 domain-containing protein n=1 Tax=Aquimarina longa TaxID=1080221 RepID=UPI0021CD3844|nr:polymorphic toxin type 10 domain-containing protein [Aquimarina longa]